MDELSMLRGTVDALLADHCTPTHVAAAEGSWAPDLWEELAQVGLTGIGMSEALGGMGGSAAEAAEVVLAAAGAAAPVPLAETMLVAGWLRTLLGVPQVHQPSSVVLGDGLTVAGDRGNWTISGRVGAVPWARAATEFMVVLPQVASVFVIPASLAKIAPGQNLAGEPRDDVEFSNLMIPVDNRHVIPDGDQLICDLRVRIALANTVKMAGALEEVLQITVTYAGQREQFGRPLSSFQAVRQSIAKLGGHAGLAVTAARAAAHHPDDVIAVLSARVAVAEAASAGAAIGHQMHGAIGFTREHRLQHLTRRLWAWRDEGGSQREWTAALGRVIEDTADVDVWSTLTA